MLVRGVVIDIIFIDFIDLFIVKIFGDVVSMFKLMGVKVVVIGI